MKTLDIVIPVFNEQEVLGKLFERLEAAFSEDKLEDISLDKVNFIFVDDGSRDDSARMIYEFLQTGVSGVLIRLSRNFGHQNAVTAGYETSRGDFLAVLDADLQDPPEFILTMVRECITRDYDVVYAVRKKRKEFFLKVFFYWVYYRILNALCDLEVSLDSGDFMVMRSRVRDAINSLPEKLRYPRGLKTWVGFRQTGLEYERSGRAAGESKYSFGDLYNLATNGITSLSIRPLRAAQLLTFCFSMGTLAIGVIFLYRYLVGFGQEYEGYYYFMYLLISLSASMILLCLYILSSYIGRTYLEVKGRPSYLVNEFIDKRDAQD